MKRFMEFVMDACKYPEGLRELFYISINMIYKNR
ncbi:hypothetical protein SDC9_191606 [bioreactor metagenome]|uniref:Uncharacterized protein n=1 Tax=bioreactor metagenome TaxID=1076179 RepID=A0A645HYC6_9ZZZZ